MQASNTSSPSFFAQSGKAAVFVPAHPTGNPIQRGAFAHNQIRQSPHGYRSPARVPDIRESCPPENSTNAVRESVMLHYHSEVWQVNNSGYICKFFKFSV